MPPSLSRALSFWSTYSSLTLIAAVDVVAAAATATAAATGVALLLIALID